MEVWLKVGESHYSHGVVSAEGVQDLPGGMGEWIHYSHGGVGNVGSFIQ